MDLKPHKHPTAGFCVVHSVMENKGPHGGLDEKCLPSTLVFEYWVPSW